MYAWYHFIMFASPHYILHSNLIGFKLRGDHPRGHKTFFFLIIIIIIIFYPKLLLYLYTSSIHTGLAYSSMGLTTAWYSVVTLVWVNPEKHLLMIPILCWAFLDMVGRFQGIRHQHP